MELYRDLGRLSSSTMSIKIDILMEMARLVLDTNCFVYDDKCYRQVRAGAMGSPFTMTLAKTSTCYTRSNP